jgi:hypothetical protein
VAESVAKLNALPAAAAALKASSAASTQSSGGISSAFGAVLCADSQGIKPAEGSAGAAAVDAAADESHFCWKGGGRVLGALVAIGANIPFT